MTSRAKGSMFAVYCDEQPGDETQTTRRAQKNASLRAPTQSTNSTRPVKRALANKENAPATAASKGHKAASAAAETAFKVFGDKQPFSDASPVKPRSSEAKQQALGFYGAGTKEGSKNTISQGPAAARRAGGFTVLSSSSSASSSNTRGSLRCGDPVKRSTKSKATSSGALGESRLRQGKALDLPAAGPSLPVQDAAASPVLANISEAYSGQGGFHWSPSSGHGHFDQRHYHDAEAQQTELDTPQGHLRMLSDAAADPSYADSPLDDTVIFRGSPVKRSRPTLSQKQPQQRPIEQRLRALRL